MHLGLNPNQLTHLWYLGDEEQQQDHHKHRRNTVGLALPAAAAAAAAAAPARGKAQGLIIQPFQPHENILMIH